MKKRTESGQAIILLVFGVLGLLGFTALAIDGGMVYLDRRQAQSASDASSLTGGGSIAYWLDQHNILYDDFNCSTQLVTDIRNYGILKASERALGNDYNDTEYAISTICEENGPNFDEKYIDIITDITKETETSFLHFVYQGRANNQVESTVRVRPSNNLAFGQRDRGPF